MNPTFTKVYEILKDCYKFIDCRCAYFKEEGKWISIVSAFRFINKEYEEIYEFHEKLRKFSQYTEWFNVDFSILQVV